MVCCGVGFVADVHVGNPKNLGGVSEAGLNLRCRLVVDTLYRACMKARELNLSAVYVAGDLFDTAHPSPQMIRAVQKIAELMDLVLLVGNHDLVSDAPGHHALAPLEPVATVVEKPTVIESGLVRVLCVPFMPGNAQEWFPREMAKLAEEGTRADAICFHLGIKDDKTSHFLVDAHDCIDVKEVAKAMKSLGAVNAFAGNWHDHRIWRTKSGLQIVQCGTLTPTGWNNPGHGIYGFMHTMHPDGSINKYQISGPRFLELRKEKDLYEAVSLQSEGHSVFVKFETGPKLVTAMQQTLDELVEEGKLAGGIALSSKKEVSKAVSEAAKKVKDSNNLEETLSAFVNGMNITEDLKPCVKEKTLLYLSSSGG